MNRAPTREDIDLGLDIAEARRRLFFAQGYDGI